MLNARWWWPESEAIGLEDSTVGFEKLFVQRVDIVRMEGQRTTKCNVWRERSAGRWDNFLFTCYIQDISEL